MKKGDDKDVYGPPQVISLLFAYNTAIPIMHEMQAFQGWEIANSANLLDPGDIQFYTILFIEIERQEKAMRELNKKVMKVFK